MKKVLVTVFGLLFVGVAGVLAWKVIGTTNQMVAQAVDTTMLIEPTKLLVSQGQATVKRTDVDPIKVTTELEVKEGDSIQLETSAKASIEWSDGSVTRLSGGADMTITKNLVDRDSGKQEAGIDLRAGEAWTKVLNVVHDDSSMQVRTQSTVAGIRGTSLYTAAFATGTIMMPLEHGVEVQITGTDTRELLLEGEGMTVQGTAMTRAGSGEIMNTFIQGNMDADEAYLAKLGEERRTAFVEMTKNVDTKQGLPDSAAFSEQFKSQQGTNTEREQKLGTLMDRLALEMMLAEDAKDPVRLAELTEYYESLLPLLKEATANDFSLRTSLRKRVQLHMAVLFSNGVTDETFLARQAVAKARFALLDEKDEAGMRRALRREMFFANDLAELGKARQVEEVLKALQTAFQKPLMETATKMEQDMFVRVAARMEASVPSATAAMTSLRRQLYLEKLEESNSNEQSNLNQNTEVEEPVSNANTNTRRVNANTNVRTNTNTNTVRRTNTNTNTAKPANTNTAVQPKPTVAPTTTVTPAPTPTLVPAPVRTTTNTTTTTRAVVTPAR